MYHVSHALNRESIKELGLIPGKGPTPWPEDNYPKGIYIFDSLKLALRYGFGNGDPFDVWVISTAGYALKEDPVTRGAFYITEHVDVKDIRLFESHVKDVTNPI